MSNLEIQSARRRPMQRGLRLLGWALLALAHASLVIGCEAETDVAADLPGDALTGVVDGGADGQGPDAGGLPAEDGAVADPDQAPGGDPPDAAPGGDPDAGSEPEPDRGVDPEPTPCEAACAAVVDCLIELCDGYGAGDADALASRCATQCTPQLVQAVAGRECRAVVDLLQQRNPAIEAECREAPPPQDGPGLHTLYIGHSFGRPFADQLTEFTQRAGVVGHRQQVVFSGGASGSPAALWDNRAKSAQAKAILDGSDVDALVMICCSPSFLEGEPDLALDQWIQYALDQNPETRFALAVPWVDFPENYPDAAAFRAPFDLLLGAWHGEVERLRAIFPGVTITTLPHGVAAMDLRAGFEADEIPELEALRGPAATSLFVDEKGHAGTMLRDVGTLVWLGTLYPEADLAAGLPRAYQTDVVEMAERILREDPFAR